MDISTHFQQYQKQYLKNVLRLIKVTEISGASSNTKSSLRTDSANVQHIFIIYVQDLIFKIIYSICNSLW